MSHLSPRDDASDSGDSATAAIAEVEAAIKANPALRGKTPPPKHAEWEDFERVLAENPELAQPVATPGQAATAFYYSKDLWDCGHAGEPARTAIEREPAAGEKDGIDMATGQIHPSAILTNEIRGICPKCMEKWSGPAADEVQDRGGSSRNPAGLASYDQAPPPGQNFDDDDDFGDAGLNRGMGTLDIDEGPAKGKFPVGGQARAAAPNIPNRDDNGGDFADNDDFDDDDFSERSISPANPEFGRPREPPPSHEPHRGGPGTSDNAPPAMPNQPPTRPPSRVERQPPAHQGDMHGGRQPSVADDFDDFDDDDFDEYDDPRFGPPPRAGPPQGHAAPQASGRGDPPPY